MTNIDAISRWATEHDAPTKTLFMEGGRAFSPNIIAEEVETGTELGMSLFIGMTAYLEGEIVESTRQSALRIADRGQA